MLTFLLIAAAIFLIMGINWNSRDPLNFTLKIMFIIMAVWGFYLAIKH